MANEGVELEIYSYANPTVLVDTVEGRKEPTFLEEYNDIGGGSFKISRKDAKVVSNPNLLKGRNVCKLKVDGKYAGAFLIQTKKSTFIGAGERAEEAYEVAGEGLKTWFNDAIVLPWAGLSKATRDKRSFSFASPTGSWYKASDWIEPIASMTWTRITGNPWKYQPTNWPSDLFPHARWVWGTAGADHVAPEGNNYFRWTYNFSVARKCSIYIAADNAWSLYLDGEEISESDPGVSTTYEAQKVDFEVDAGAHVIGILVNNGNKKVSSQHAGLLAGLVYYTTDVPDVNLGTVTIDIGTNARVHRQSHGLNNDDKVYFSSTGQLPEPLSTERNYYVADRDANSFVLQRTTDGVYLDTKGAQSGTHTLFKAGSDAYPKLLSYTGLTSSYANNGQDDAVTHENNAHSKYTALPAGSNDDKATKKQKQQYKVKAAAKTRWQKATTARKQWDTEVTAAGSGQQWRVLPYPNYVPGWTPGGILLKLMAEATSRGVRFPSWLHPTFTDTVDSNGVAWGNALEWTFDVGKDNLYTVVSKMEELQVSVWIDPATLNLNMALNRGTDRGSDANAVVFEQGKNILAASTQLVSKIKNSLILKTNKGWAPDTVDQDQSQLAYGTIEDVIDYDGSLSTAQSIALNTFAVNAIEEEGASYDIFPTDKIPGTDFFVGDWVSAPNDTGTNVKRRVVSLAVSESDNGEPNWAIEFDTIFHANEDKLNRRIQKIGQRGATGASGVAAGGQVASSQSNLLLPPAASPLIIPNAPDNTVGYAAAVWDASGSNIIAEAVLTWDPVDTATDGSQIVASGYTIFARQIVDASDPNDDSSDDWTQWTTSAIAMAVIPGFTPGDQWQFMVAAQSPYGSDFIGDFGDVVTVTMGVPTAPMDPPTAPVVTAKLGVAIITWDGQLKGSDGSLHSPDPQFREITVGVSTTPGGPYDYTKGTPITIGSPQAYITGYNIGTVLYAVMKSVDGIGIQSDASDEGHGTITGVDLGSLTQDLQNNLAATSQAASDAGTIAAQSAATAGTALTTAQGAATAAANAQTSANGKNKITYSTVAAASSTPGTAIGDVWYQYSGANLVGWWRWDGTAWQTQTISNTVIGTLDAGKITTGSLDSARISARSISATQIALTDTTNLIPNQSFDPAYPNGWTGVGSAYTAADLPPGYTQGRGWQVNSRDNIAPGIVVQVQPGDSFYFEIVAKRLSGSAPLKTSLWILKADGSSGSGDSPAWNPFDPLNQMPRGMTSIADYGNGWNRYQAQVTIPKEWKNVDHANFYLQIDQSDNSTTWAFVEQILRRAAGAQLIVDGSITAQHIGAASITGDRLQANTITTNQIAAGAITTNNLSAGAIDGVVVTSAVVRSNNNPGYTGVQLDGNGIHAWYQGNMVFDINSNGNVYFSGGINAGSGTFNGTINAQAGSISGNLSVTGTLSVANNGALIATRSDGLTTRLDVYGVKVSWPGQPGGAWMQNGTLSVWDGSTGGYSGRTGDIYIDDAGMLFLKNSGNGIRLAFSGAAFYVTSDGSGGRIYSMDIRNRTYSSSNRTSSTGNQIMVNTSSGTLGVLTSTIDSTYIATSARKYKYDIEDYNPGLRVLDLQPRQFKYKEDDRSGVGMIAEELDEAGFPEFVHRDPETNDIETIDYVFFGAALLSLAKAQAAQIKELQDALLNK